MLKLFKALLVLFVVALIALAAAGGAFYWYVNEPLDWKGERLDVEVSPGSSLRATVRELIAGGVPIDPWSLVVLGRLLRVDSSIKAGSYEFERGLTPLSLLNKLTRGDVTQTEVAFIEGWTFRQMRARLDANPDLRHETTGLPDAEIMRRLGAPGEWPEGRFFPDTYLCSKQSRDLDVLARAHRAMRRHLAQAWAARAPDLPYVDPDQALTMASIVEKETGREADRSLVAAVFVNRLKQGMPLQTDPTVIYGLGEAFDGNLRKRDLLSDTPYNTYLRPGLPPTPIAMPGLASLRAALHPATSEVLYFVARGDGSSQFSRTLAEHNQAVNRYQRGGK